MEAILQTPKFILISREALSKHPEQVIEALRLTPVAGAFCTADLDAKLCQGIADPQIGVVTPFVLVADFPFEFAVVSEGGAFKQAELPECLNQQS
jgi:hypothetical protein